MTALRKRYTLWLAMGMLLLAYTLYLIQLDGQSLWRDEGLTVVRSQQSLTLTLSNRNEVQGTYSPDLHPPLYFLVLHGWRFLAGSSEFALRFPSVAATVLALALLVRLGHRVWGTESGLWAMALATLSPFVYWYAQEARMYSWVILESLVLLLTLWPLLQQGASRKDYAQFGVAAAVLSYTHYGGVFLVAFAALTILACWWGQRRWWGVIILLVSIALASIPLAPHIWALLNQAGFQSFSKRGLLTMAWEAASTFALGSAGPPVDPGWRMVPFLSLALAGAGAFGIKPVERHRRAILIGVGALLIPLTLYFFASWLQANYSNPRHLITLSPAWYLVVGHGLTTLRKRFWPLALVLGLACAVIGGTVLLQTVTDPPLKRDDIRGLAQYIQERARPGDAVLWHNAIMMTTYDYYALELPYTALPRFGSYDPGATIHELQSWTQAHERIWFVSSPTPFDLDQTVVRDWMDSRMIRIDEASFAGSWTVLNLQLMQPLREMQLVPELALPVDVDHGPYHISAALPEKSAISGQGMWLSLFWHLNAEPPTEPQTACLRLVDSAAVIWSETCIALQAPVAMDPPPLALQMEQPVWLGLPPGLAPVTYQLDLVLGDQVHSIGPFAVEAPDKHFDSDGAADLGEIELLNVEWAADSFRPGLWAVGDLVWRVQTSPSQAYTITAKVVDWLGKEVARQSQPLAPADYPATRWEAGEHVRSRLGILLPYGLDGRYRVYLSVTKDNGTTLQSRGLIPRDWARIGSILLEDWPYEQDLPLDVGVEWSDVYMGTGIQLEGSSLSHVGDQIRIDLYWRCHEPIDRDFGVFVHVARPGEPPLAQDSGGPANWTRLTSSWRVGELVTDSHAIRLPADLDTKGLSILVGMYDLQNTDIRLPVTLDGQEVQDNALNLGTVP